MRRSVFVCEEHACGRVHESFCDSFGVYSFELMRTSPRTGPEQPQRAVIRRAASVRVAPERAEGCEIDSGRTQRDALAEYVLEGRRGCVGQAVIGEGEPVQAKQGRGLTREIQGRRRAPPANHRGQLSRRPP